MNANESGRVQSFREAVRYRVGWWASEPFWKVYQFGMRAERVHARLLGWAERDTKGSHV